MEEKSQRDLQRLTGQFRTVIDSNPIPPEHLISAGEKTTPSIATQRVYVDTVRIQQIQNIGNDSFDLSRLIQMCNEINDAFEKRNFIAVILLVRAVLDHVPPIFGHRTFEEVVSNYPLDKSVKKTFEHLQKSSRNIADIYLHTVVRKAETTPTETQINFSRDLDILLGEIVRILKSQR